LPSYDWGQRTCVFLPHRCRRLKALDIADAFGHIGIVVGSQVTPRSDRCVHGHDWHGKPPNGDPMIPFFRRIRIWLSPPVSRRQAVEIAREQCTLDRRSFAIYDRMPANTTIYYHPPEPCWFVLAPWGDGYDGRMLRSSRLILVSKASGKVLFDGSANDEG